MKPSPQALRAVGWGLALTLAGLMAETPGSEGWPGSLDRRNYWVRIGIGVNKDVVALAATGPIDVFGAEARPLTTLRAGQVYLAEIQEGRPGGYVYRLVVRELSPGGEQTALTLAGAAREAYRLTAKAVRLPAAEAEGEEKLLVLLGEFATVQAAQAFRSTLPEGEALRIFQERGTARQGEVRLRTVQGQAVAASPTMLRLEPQRRAEDSIYVQGVNDLRAWRSDAVWRGRNYRDSIELIKDQEGKLTVVNHLWLEHYLYGVVASEIGNFAPAEALKAQAVVARSEAVAKLERGIVSANPWFDFTDSALIQAYNGKGLENAAVRRAVDTTRGEILVYNGRAVDAVYSHSCGGVIASTADLWDSDGQGYSRRHLDRLGSAAVPDLAHPEIAHEVTSHAIAALCNPDQPGFPSYARGHFRWMKTLSADQLTSLMDRAYGTGRVKDLLIERRSAGGRVRTMKVIGERRTVVIDRELAIRSSLGQLKSTFFTVEVEEDAAGNLARATIHGAGFGHGVGLCQMGAYVLALQSYNYRQILGHYFTQVKIRRLYA